MPHQEMVAQHYPEAQCVEEPPGFRHCALTDRGRWFVYAGPDSDARVLGRGTTEAQAWWDAALRLGHTRRTVRRVVAV